MHLKQSSEDIHNLTYLGNYIGSIYLACKEATKRIKLTQGKQYKVKKNKQII